jgi:CO/xanthine dehydrogenase FAD-binding subunit
VRGERLHHRLITQVAIPANARLAYEYVARTPADRPVVCVAAAQWPSGRTRLAVGGFGPAPRLALDGTESEGAGQAARSACSQAQDAWASAEYRQEVAQVLAERCVSSLAG